MTERRKVMFMVTAIMLLLSGLFGLGLWIRDGCIAGLGFFIAYNIVTVWMWLPRWVRDKVRRW